jgi:hypothetical protein
MTASPASATLLMTVPQLEPSAHAPWKHRLEKRAIFYKGLIPWLEFEREREGIDLSRIVLTHHTLRNNGQRSLRLGGDSPTLRPLTDSGSGSVQEKEKALLQEIACELFFRIVDGLLDQRLRLKELPFDDVVDVNQPITLGCVGSEQVVDLRALLI